MKKRLFLKLCILLFWTGLIFSTLYFPQWLILPYEEKTLNVFSWGDILEPSVVAQFEKETGIRVHLSYYSSNEELLVKLKATHGEGYDLIIPSDYAIPQLVEEGLLKEINRSSITFWDALNPRLLGHPFDPQNHFSIPFEWEIFGLGIDQNYFNNEKIDPSWKLLFNPVSYKVAMTNDPIEALQLAAFYLFGPFDKIQPAQVPQVKQLLFQQKRSVEAYAASRADYFLATRNTPVVVASSSYIWRTMRLFPFVGFIIPREGTFITIENLCLPAASKKDKLAYAFINYLFRPESIAKHYETFGFFPAATNVTESLRLDPLAEALMSSSKEQFKNYHFFKNVLPQQQIRDIWVEVKTYHD